MEFPINYVSINCRHIAAEKAGAHCANLLTRLPDTFQTVKRAAKEPPEDDPCLAGGNPRDN
jgi:hypothetical protein